MSYSDTLVSPASAWFPYSSPRLFVGLYSIIDINNSFKCQEIQDLYWQQYIRMKELPPPKIMCFVTLYYEMKEISSSRVSVHDIFTWAVLKINLDFVHWRFFVWSNSVYFERLLSISATTASHFSLLFVISSKDSSASELFSLVLFIEDSIEEFQSKISFIEE